MKVLITGTAGFIGFHLARQLLGEGFKVLGYDGITDYYDKTLKQERHNILLKNSNFSATEGMLEDNNKLDEIANKFQPDVIVHLAAQAGVRYSLENPSAYINSNVSGFGNILSGSLERSNVDITEELVNLITAQRNFQASAKAIETTTTLTQTIINIRG